MATHHLFLDVKKQDCDQNSIKYKMEKIYCMCCLSHSMHLINMNTCEHTTFLRGTLDLKLDLFAAYVCVVCHNMLKKIEEFKNQIQASMKLLTSTNQVQHNRIKKLFNLTNTRLQIISVTDPDTDIEMKPEIIIEIPKNLDIDNGIKTEEDFSDSESPCQETTKKRGKQFDKYEGKIKAMTLTLEELMEERERAAKQEKYLRLPYRCEHCITAFDHEITWRTHMEKRHTKTENNFQCDICKSVLSSKIAYNEHMRRHMRRLECMECGKRYSTEQCAMQHYDENHLPSGSSLQRGYTCGECGFTTTVHRAYRYHKDKHKEKRQCTLCTNTFVNDSGLRMHMFTVHKQSSRTYRCEPCDKTYTTRSGLIAHKRAAHTFVPKSYCDTCRTHYPSAQALRTHLTTHSKHVNDNDKRFICDECGAKFLKKSILQIHINWDHLKLNNNKCDICDKVFKYATALRRHVDYVHRKHRPPRNKICHYCGRGFTTQNILKFHLRTHTGERPLQCQHCQATFAHNGALYTHIKLKHGGVK